MTDTSWMLETFTKAEKRDCALAVAKGMRQQLVETMQTLIDAGHGPVVTDLQRQIDILDAIAADYDFKARQQELEL